MTDKELRIAIIKYEMQKSGQKKLLNCLSDDAVRTFVNEYFENIEERTFLLDEGELLRRAFLSIFSGTKESSNFMIFLNFIKKTNSDIDDLQPWLTSIDWENKNKAVANGLNVYGLYCNLETNKPVLISEENSDEFIKSSRVIPLPNYVPKTESYHYISDSLDVIDKGSATISFNRLQLYYFRELLKTSKEDAMLKMSSLSNEEVRKICLKK